MSLHPYANVCGGCYKVRTRTRAGHGRSLRPETCFFSNPILDYIQQDIYSYSLLKCFKIPFRAMSHIFFLCLLPAFLAY